MRFNIFIVPLLLLSGCATLLNRPEFTPLCRHNSIFHAVTVRETYPVRIVSGSTPSGVRHAQAQYHDGLKWQWLDSTPVKIRASEQHPFTPDITYTLEEYLDRLDRQLKRRDHAIQ